MSPNNFFEGYVHKSDEKHFCQICDKVFAHKSSLKDHVQSAHQGIRFKCDTCEEDFTNPKNLTRHQKEVHKGDKYPCDECGREICSKSDLKNHMKSVHGGVKIRQKCLKCDKTFANEKWLGEHNRTTHLGLRYQCIKCEAKFTKKTNLDEHVRKLIWTYYDANV